MYRERYPQPALVRVLEDVMGAPGVVNIKTGPLEGLEDFGRPQSWEVPAHAGSGIAI
jgi:hypothetical protein